MTDQDFNTWRVQTFEPFAGDNKQDHVDILKRLDKLNGFHNLILGAGALIGFCTPAGIAIWAILATR